MPSINLQLPKSWNALTVPQLESVSRIFIDTAKSYTATGNYDQADFLVKAFFAISGFRITSLALSDEPDPEEDSDDITTEYDTDEDNAQHGSNSSLLTLNSSLSEAPHSSLKLATASTPPEHTYYNCEFIDEQSRIEQQTVDGKVVPIRIYLNEILSLSVGEVTQKDLDTYFAQLDRHAAAVAAGRNPTPPSPPKPKGPLAWLLSPCTLVRFPYPELTLPDPKHKDRKERWLNPKTCAVEVRPYPKTVTLSGPDELMQNFTWRQYRFLTEIMSLLQQYENSLVSLQKKLIELTLRHKNSINASPSVLRQQESIAKRIEAQNAAVKEVRAQWLATLFSRPLLYEDPDTRQLVYEPHFVPSQGSDNAYLFADFPEEKFQAISFWYQGMMLHLQHQFPKVFRRDKVGSKSADDNPFQLYTRSTTTMIKYAAANEDEVNHTTYTIILQHIQDMAEENDRVEAMRKSHK